MKYVADHDLHIHSLLSLCSGDSAQTPQAILEYGIKNGYNRLCLTDHMWDGKLFVDYDFYKRQTFEHICQSLPLPQDKDVKFLFGAEADMDVAGRVGLTKSTIDRLDFIIIPTTHLHMDGFTIKKGAGLKERIKLYVSRFEKLLDLDLPFKKVGFAHLSCPLIFPGEFKNHIEVLKGVSNGDYKSLFRRSADLGMGIELNFDVSKYKGDDLEDILRPYRIAKNEGCKFYLGSDAHHPAKFITAKENFERIIDLLELEESDKFIPHTK